MRAGYARVVTSKLKITTAYGLMRCAKVKKVSHYLNNGQGGK